MNLRSHFNILHTINTNDTALPDVQPLINQCLNTRIRRIDRYIKLCLAGGLNCAKGHTLPTDTGLYIATRCGTVGTSAKIMQHIEHNGDLPKPVNFINGLGNSAGFYLTAALRLTGNTLVVSQEMLSFEAALLHAWIDLQQGRISTALVGGLDEVVMPVEQHIERLEGSEKTKALTEGSHWLLLTKQTTNTQSLHISQPEFFSNLDTIALWLEAHPVQILQTSFSPTSSEKTCLEKHNNNVQYYTNALLPDTLVHGTFSGAALVGLCETVSNLEVNISAIHLSRGDNGGFCAVRVTQKI